MIDLPPGDAPDAPDPLAWDPLASPRPQPGSIHDLPYADPDDPLDVSTSRWSALRPRFSRGERAPKGGPSPSHAAPPITHHVDQKPAAPATTRLPPMPPAPVAPTPRRGSGPLPPAASLPATMWEPTFQPSPRALPDELSVPPPALPPPPVTWAAPENPPSGPLALGGLPPLPLPPDAPTPPSYGAPAPTPGPRVAEGVLVGLAAAGVAGLGWWAVAAATQQQFVYLAIVIGFGVGQAVVIGARRGSIVLGLFALFVTLASLAVAEYFIQRTLAIQQLHADIPLWNGFGTAGDVVRQSLRDEPITYLFWALAAGIACFRAALPSARPII